MSNCSSEDGVATRSATNTQTFLETYDFKGDYNSDIEEDHRELVEYLSSYHVDRQSDLVRCLLRGLQIIQWKERESSHVVQALALLLQLGAKWNSNALLDYEQTLYHIICESSGDHHELLDLILKSLKQTIIDKQDIYNYTALLYAVRCANINCLKCLIKN